MTLTSEISLTAIYKSGKCKEMKDMVKESQGGAYLWQYVKPLLRGKIVYTPDNALTREIMREANATFDRMASISQTLKAMVKTNEDLMRNVNDSDIQKIKVVVLSCTWCATYTCYSATI